MDEQSAVPRGAEPSVDAGPKRPLPALNNDTRAYWTGGSDGKLLIYQCGSCAYYVHPPVRYCPKCGSREVGPQPVSGRGTVVTYTVNHRQWLPNLPIRYVVAMIAIEEQEDVRLVTNIVNCTPEEVTIGMPVQVRFEQCEEVWVPLFEPIGKD